MPRKLSHIAPDWRDYATLDSALINDAAKLTARDLRQLSRPGFKVVMCDTLEDAAVPMCLLADHPNVQFNYFQGGLGSCAVEMH